MSEACAQGTNGRETSSITITGTVRLRTLGPPRDGYRRIFDLSEHEVGSAERSLIDLFVDPGDLHEEGFELGVIFVFREF